MLEAGKPHLLDIVHRAGFALFLGNVGKLQTEGDIAQDSCPGKKAKS